MLSHISYHKKLKRKNIYLGGKGHIFCMKIFLYVSASAIKHDCNYFIMQPEDLGSATRTGIHKSKQSENRNIKSYLKYFVTNMSCLISWHGRLKLIYA
jgi:hypothetical protein